MGKKKIKKLGEKTELKIVKSGKQHGRIADVSQEALEETTEIEKKAKELEKEITAETEKGKKQAKARPAKKRSRRYQEARLSVDRTKIYPLSEAINLLKITSISSFNGTVEVHLNTKAVGLKGEVKFPHSTGKTVRIAIANEEIIKKIEQGKIDFSVLLATPEMMPKLAKYARILGPKGLMPNPKAGTITEKPEETAKKMAGKAQFKTELKFPLIHQVIGKADDKPQQLEENFQALIQAVGAGNIQKAVITTTMGPGIKVSWEK